MRSSLDPNEEHEPLIAALIDVLEPHWKEQSQSNGLYIVLCLCYCDDVFI